MSTYIFRRLSDSLVVGRALEDFIARAVYPEQARRLGRVVGCVVIGDIRNVETLLPPRMAF